MCLPQRGEIVATSRLMIDCCSTYVSAPVSTELRRAAHVYTIGLNCGLGTGDCASTPWRRVWRWNGFHLDQSPRFEVCNVSATRELFDPDPRRPARPLRLAPLSHGHALAEAALALAHPLHLLIIHQYRKVVLPQYYSSSLVTVGAGTDADGVVTRVGSWRQGIRGRYLGMVLRYLSLAAL